MINSLRYKSDHKLEAVNGVNLLLQEKCIRETVSL